MQKRLRFPLAALLFAALAFVGFQVFYSKEREPMYEGKCLSAWLKASTRVVDVTPVEDMRMSEADEVVRQVGTNAIPTLLRMLRVKDSALKVRLINLAMRQHVVKITPAENWNNAAARAFWVLGTNAQSAVPALMEIASQSISPNSQYCAITALGSVGPPAKEAVPALLRWATNSDWEVRCCSLYALGEIHDSPGRVVPVLIDALHDPQNRIQRRAVVGLGKFGPEAEVAVPALLEFLHATNLNRPYDYDNRRLATNALSRIDPEAAAKAGVK